MPLHEWTIQLPHSSFIMPIDLTLPGNKVVASYLSLGVLYEEDSCQLFCSVLEPGDWFIDIGAYKGWFTLLAGSIVGAGGHVVAVEPVPWNYDDLVWNVGRNGFLERVTCINAAVGSHDGTAEFWVNRDSDSGGALWNVGHHEANPMSRDNPCTIEVKMLTLDGIIDNIIREHPEACIKAIKIDTEGAEVDVFNGGSKWLASGKIPYVVAEMHTLGLQLMGHDAQEMLDVMCGHGYHSYITKGVPETEVVNVLFALEEFGNESCEDSQDKGE